MPRGRRAPSDQVGQGVPALHRHGPKRIRLGLLANALRWRAGSSVVFCIVALLAVAAATAGPVYLAAADQSVLEHVLVPAPPVATGLLVNPQPGLYVSYAAVRQDLRVLPRSPTGRPFFARPIFTEIAGSQILARSGHPVTVSDIVSRSQVCMHLVFARGHCPTGPDTLALSTRSAAYLGLGLGSVIRLSVGTSVFGFRVSGLYSASPASAPYWWGADYFLFGSAQSPPPRMDDLFVNPSAFSRLPQLQVAVNAQVPVDTSGLLSTQVPAFRQALRTEELRLGRSGFDANSAIGSYLDDVSSQQQAMTTTISVIDLQLLLLVLMVLFGIAGRIAAQRDQDLGLANLRGLARRSLWAVALEGTSRPHDRGRSGRGLRRMARRLRDRTCRARGRGAGRFRLARAGRRCGRGSGRARRYRRGLTARASALGRAGARPLTSWHSPDTYRRSLRDRSGLRRARATLGVGSGNKGEVATVGRARAGAHRPRCRRDRGTGSPALVPVARSRDALFAKGRSLPRAATRGTPVGHHPPVGGRRHRGEPCLLRRGRLLDRPLEPLSPGRVPGRGQSCPDGFGASERRLRAGGTRGRPFRPRGDGRRAGVEPGRHLAGRRRQPFRRCGRLGRSARERLATSHRPLPQPSGRTRRGGQRCQHRTHRGSAYAGQAQAVLSPRHLQRAVRRGGDDLPRTVVTGPPQLRRLAAG